MVTIDILTELELREREESIRKNILLDGKRREKYLKALLRQDELDEKISWYESQMRVNY
jgi:hypothetical protein